jgi:carbon storage regulator CsrA
MLVLTRKPNEEIVIPRYGITVSPVQIKGDKVRLGITAPPEVEVYRREVWERMQAKAASDQAEPGIEPPMPGPHILVVEDNPDCRWGLETLLKMMGYRVEAAEDGIDGLEKALRGKPPVLLVDLNMPRMNGLELARRLRSQPGFEHAALVAVSGCAQYQDKMQSIEAGFDAHLTKPIDIDELRAVLAHINPVAA